MFVLDTPNFSLAQTYDSCQSLTWDVRPGFESFIYLIRHREHLIKVQQFPHSKGVRTAFGCNDEQFFDIWFPYFDLATDYKLVSNAARLSGPFVAEASDGAEGLHLLNQDPWECILSEFLFCGRSLEDARLLLDAVCYACSEEKHKTIKGVGRVEWFPIPRPYDIIEKQDDLEWFLDVEFAEVIISLAEKFSGHRGYLGVSGLGMSMEDQQKMSRIMSHDFGMPQSKIDKILMHGYGRRDIACIPPRSKKLIEQKTGLDIEDWIEWELGKLAGYEGYAGALLTRQQVLKMKGRR